jgi:hypothetical protein
MQILFNKTIEQCRKIGARGGRAHARNLRMRRVHAASKPADVSAPQFETAAEAVALLDRQFPWLIGAEKARRPVRGGVHEASAVL